MEIRTVNDRPWREHLDSFLKEPTREGFLHLLQREAVEDNDLEFKRSLLPSDLMAKHILAMANKNGGAVVFGVDEHKPNQFSPCGLPEGSDGFDVTNIEKKLASYIPKKLEIGIIPAYVKGEEHSDFENKFFLIIIVSYNPRHIPFVSLKSGENLKRDTIYVRRNRASEPANHDEIQEIINKRIDTEYSTTNERKLIEHLEELKELYSHIPRTVREVVSFIPPLTPLDLGFPIEDMKRMFGKTEYKTSSNPEYPQESYESFIRKLIEIKKDEIVNLMKRT
ncbi:MAG: ATP-binding protein [Stenomitos rutilans HA7619-LM2]|jgi:hypothetical protein|nr:ATP-binding protein [Stenomitos rutilans HA7619-LM2]